MSDRQDITNQPRGRSRLALRTRALAGISLVALCLLVAGCGSSQKHVSRLAKVPESNSGVDPGTSLDNQPAPNFHLVDQFGKPVSLKQFRGKAVILAFVDSRCTTVCPLTTVSMMQAMKLLGPAAKHVQLIGINANPDATRVSDVRAYSVAHQMMHNWVFLTGSLNDLKSVWKSYHVFVEAIAGNIDHEAAVYLIRPDGREQMLFLTQMSYAAVSQQAQVLADATATALPGDVSARNVVNLKAGRPIPPSAPLSLGVVGGDRSKRSITLGAGHAHLVLFFATWTDENADLSRELLALNQYQATAKRRHWPSLVAIDEATTEPSPSALPDALARLHHPLDYPVLLDRTGEIAQGYGVQDEPWVELVSSSGKILFHNDGWFSPGALQRAVGKALASQRH